jgi:hypothetical protein
MNHSMAHWLEMHDSVLWSLVALYICFTLQLLMVLAFHVYSHRPLPHERCWSVWGKPCIRYHLWALDLEVFSVLCSILYVIFIFPWRLSSNLAVESRDKIPFKGGRL